MIAVKQCVILYKATKAYYDYSAFCLAAFFFLFLMLLPQIALGLYHVGHNRTCPIIGPPMCC